MAYQEIIFSPAELMQTALTKVNENFVELYNNLPPNIGTMVGVDPTSPTVVSVDVTKNIYYVDCTGGDVTASFDVSAFGNRVVCFTRIDNSAYKFRIDEVSGTPSVMGEPLPYITDMIQYDSIDVNYYNNVFYIKG